MRLHEVEDPEKHDDVIKTLYKYFTITGTALMDHNGFINVNGGVHLNASDFTNIDALPVKFKKVSGNFSCPRAGLTTLEGSPEYVGGVFICWGNRLTSLKGGPKRVGDRYSCYNNHFTSLDGLPAEMKDGWIFLDYNANLPMLKLLFIKGLDKISIEAPDEFKEKTQLQEILNKYIGTGRQGALKCAAELSAAGFKNNARM